MKNPRRLCQHLCCRVRPVCSMKSHYRSCTQDCHRLCHDRSRAGYHSNQSLMRIDSRRPPRWQVRPVYSKMSHHRSYTQDWHWCNQNRSHAGYHSNQSLMRIDSRPNLVRQRYRRARSVCSMQSHHRSCTQDFYWWSRDKSRADYHWNQSLMRIDSRRHLCCRERPVCSKKSHHRSCNQDCKWWRQYRSRAGYHSNQSLMRIVRRLHLCCRVRPVCSRKGYSERKQKKNLHHSSPMLTSLYSHHLSQ